MTLRQARGREGSLTRACGDNENHQKSVMEGRALPTVFGGMKFMQRVFTAIEQVVRNTVQTMQVPVRAADSRTTMTMKAFI